jgi:hypothetical protein
VIAILVVGGAAMAQEHVRVELSGATVDWTTGTIEVTTAARGYGVGSEQATVEMEARRDAGRVFLDASRAIQVTADATVGDLESDPALHDALPSRMALWGVAEARYYASGTVELSATLPLQELLKPWTIAAATVAAKPIANGATGVVVDATGVSLSPAFAPRLLGRDGDVLYDGKLSQDAAIDALPVIYVHGAADPAAVSRVGAHPLVVHAVAGSAVGSTVDVRIAPEDLSAFAAASPDGVLHAGKLVIVVAP